MNEDTENEVQPAVTPVDLISQALQERPIDFADVLGSLLADRALEALEYRRSEIANDLFVNNPVDYEEPEYEEQEDNTGEVDEQSA